MNEDWGGGLDYRDFLERRKNFLFNLFFARGKQMSEMKGIQRRKKRIERERERKRQRKIRKRENERDKEI